MQDLSHKLKSFSQFAKLVNTISNQNPFQGKSIKNFITQQEDNYWSFANQLCEKINHHFITTEKDWEQIATSYNQTCKEILREQIRFKKTGVYLNTDPSFAKENVYSEDKVMRPYILGLLLTYLFWPQHYAILQFFKKHLTSQKPQKTLEIGAGHGLFAIELLQQYPETPVTIVDISESSINLTKEMLAAFKLNEAKVNFIHSDYLKTKLEPAEYDFIILGEVLEHVQDVKGFLNQTNRLIKRSGKIFISTCANCPAIDHVYHFRNVNSIRQIIHDTNLKIEKEIALPLEQLPEEKWEEDLVTVNYCAILGK